MRKLLIIIALLGIFVPNANAQSANDISAQLEDLGIPSKKAGYAKNIWDMQLWNGKIYIGTGNSSNSAPNSNAGPIPIISLNPATGQYVDEFVVDEEQIEVFRNIDGVLTIPGHDSKESWSLGNFYRFENVGWKKYRTVPNGIHVYDMISFGGKWFAAIGADATKSVAVFSSDQGQTWTGSTTLNSKPEINEYHTRIYRYYEIGGELYTNDFRGIYKFEGNDFVQLDPQIYMNMLPNYAGATRPQAIQGVPVGFPYASRLERGITFNNNFVYIGADGVNDHQWQPMGLYKSSQIGSATKIILPNNATAWDILVRGQQLYVLGDIKIDNTHHIVTVSKTTDLNNWEEIMRFNADTFARSFEEASGYFYFGLGSDTTTIPADTGKVFKVAYSSAASPTPIPTKPGDANADNKVDGIDYIIWLNHYNQNVTGPNNGDFNNSGKVDGVDYVIWLNNYGK